MISSRDADVAIAIPSGTTNFFFKVTDEGKTAQFEFTMLTNVDLLFPELLPLQAGIEEGAKKEEDDDEDEAKPKATFEASNSSSSRKPAALVVPFAQESLLGFREALMRMKIEEDFQLKLH